MTATMRGPSRRSVVAVLGSVLAGALVVRGSGMLALIAPSIFGLLLLSALVKLSTRWPDDPDADERILRWTMAAFVAHLVFGLLVSTISNPLNYLRTDAVGYHHGAVGLVNFWSKGLPPPILPAGKEGFYYLLGGLYWVFGPRIVAGLAVNAALAAALVPLLSNLTHRLFGRDAARYAPPLVVLLPGIFLWTSQLLKEAPVLFLIAVAAYFAVRISERVSLAALVGMAASLALLFTFRSQVALVMAGGLLAGMVFSSKQLLGGLSSGLAAAVLVAVLVLTLGVGLSGYKSAVQSDLTQANTVRQDLAQSESGIQPGADISTPGRALSYLPVGVVDFLLGPFPWQLRSAAQVFSLADVFVWWGLLPVLWRGLRTARRHRGRRSLVLILPAAVTTVVLALAVGNFGTIVRERTQVVILLVPLLALGLAARAESRSKTVTEDETPALAAR